MDPGFLISDVLFLLLSIIADQAPVGMIVCFVAVADELFTPKKK
jgi:hypothetical protein